MAGRQPVSYTHLVALIRAERHVDNDHGTLHTANHGFAMINHLVERDGKRGDLSLIHI